MTGAALPVGPFTGWLQPSMHICLSTDACGQP